MQRDAVLLVRRVERRLARGGVDATGVASFGVVPDVDGHVVVYQDSQAAGETYFAHQFSDLRIVDRDTGAKRVVMPLDTYYGVGIWERWIVFNNYGMYGDSLIICDLVEAGYMSDDLHVISE